MGAEFAQQFPKIAGRLGMNGLEVADPYVERLLEGVGFLAARVQLKLDAEFPRFTQALLEIVYPHYLAPTPSMLVAQLKPDPNDPNLAPGPNGAARQHDVRACSAADDATACEFRTAHDVTLWPVEIVSASYFSFAPDLPLNALPVAQRIKGGVRIRLKATAGLKFAQTAIDRLCFYLAGRDDVANKLYELCLATGLGRAGAAGARPRRGGTSSCRPAAIRPVGFADDEALLPVTLRSFQGYRLLQEYFSFPQRFRFFELPGLARGAQARRRRRARARDPARAAAMPTLESVVDASNLALFCTPAINLFHEARRSHPRQRQRARVSRRRRPDPAARFRDLRGHERRRPRRRDRQRTAVPAVLLGVQHRSRSISSPPTSRRAASRGWSSQPQKRRGSRSSYIGTRGVPLARRSGAGAVQRRPAPAVDPGAVHESRSRAADAGRRRHDATCRSTSPRRSRASASSAVRAVRTRRWPTAPWRGARSATCRSTTCRSCSRRRRKGRPRCAICSSCTRRARTSAPGGRSRGSGRCASAASCAGCVAPGPLAFGRGLEITVQVDELAFEGGSAFLLGVGARSILRASRVDQLVHRNRAAVGEPRGNQPMGASNGARDRRSSVLRGAGGAPYRYDFYQTLRRLECLYDEQAALGRGAAVPSTSPCGWDRIPICRLRRRRWRRSRPRRRGRRGSRSGCSACSVRTDRCRFTSPSTRASGCAIAAIRRSAAFSIIFHHRFLALFYRAWAQAQPHVNRDRPNDDRFAGYVGAFIGMCAGGVSRSRRAAGSREVLPRRRAHPPGPERRRAGAHSPALLPRAGADRGVRRPLDVA